MHFFKNAIVAKKISLKNLEFYIYHTGFYNSIRVPESLLKKKIGLYFFVVPTKFSERFKHTRL